MLFFFPQKKSAEQKNLLAQLMLSYIYFTENCGFYNIDKTIEYFWLASDQGNSKVQFILGYIYHIGEYLSRYI